MNLPITSNFEDTKCLNQTTFDLGIRGKKINAQRCPQARKGLETTGPKGVLKYCDSITVALPQLDRLV